MHRGRRAARVVVGGVAVGALAFASGCVTDLGVPEGFDLAGAGAVAPNGLIAGYAQDLSDQFPYDLASSAFLLDDGEYTMIPPPPPFTHASAAAVNSSGMVAGSFGENGGRPRVPFVWTEAGGAQVVPVPSDPTTDVAWASAMNEGGQVVAGVAPGGNYRASTSHLWTPGEAIRELAPLPGMVSAGATDINDAGQVVGNSGLANGTSYPVMWEPPLYEPAPLPMPPAPVPSGLVQAYGLSLDHDGTAVGTVWNGETNLAVLWSPAAGHPFTVLPLGDYFTPADIDHGTIVGTKGPNLQFSAVMLRPGSTELEGLGTLEGGTSSASAISGDKIVGSADIDGLSHVAVFTPVP